MPRRKRQRPAVGVIGQGIMGSAISASLLRAGFALCGTDIAAPRRAALARAGGRALRGTREVCAEASVLLTSLPSAAALRAVAAELVRHARAGTVVIETSTLALEDKQRARHTLAARHIVLLDCPLSGTGAQARSGDLVVYASGDRAACRKAVTVFEGFARAHHYLGDFGNGSRMKFVANLLVAIHNVSAAEALVLGMKAGLDPRTVVRVGGEGAGGSRMLLVRGPMMAAGRFAPATMSVGMWQKDMRIIGEFARALGVKTPLFNASAPIYDAALAQGFAAEDTAAVCAVLEKRSRVRRKPHG
jgi:3-hydroxyisobutyrate dehydrogenase-like beta-hydroxyacid dehydrogenase